MSLSLIDTIADAMVTELNNASRTWNGKFTAARENYPVFGDALDVLTELTVRVIPFSRPSNVRMTRGTAGALTGRRSQNRIDISVQQKTADISNESFDPLKLLTEQLETWFLDGHDLGVGGRTQCIESAIDPYPDRPVMVGIGAYTAIIQLTFETI